MSEEIKKRKTHTSSEVKARYNKKVYSLVACQLPKDLVEAFRAKCAEEGIPQAQIIRAAIEKFLSE